MNKDLTVGKPSQVLWQFCLPMFGSIIFQQLYNIAGAVSSASGSQIQEARAAYDALTLDEQKQIRNLSVLEHAEAAYAALTQNGANARPGTGEGNQETLESLRNGGNTFGLSDLAQNGQNMTGEVAGTIEGVLPEEAHDAQAQDQTQIPVEDTQLPDWLASQLDEGQQRTVQR